jgi:hypothetical protein
VRRLATAAWFVVLFFSTLAFVAWAVDGPLTNGANIPVRTDANGYLMAAAQTYTGPDGPRRTLANELLRTDANGYLIITNPSGFGGSTSATTVTTTGTIDDLNFGTATVIRMNNASDATIRGLVAGSAGQTVTIESVGAGHVFFSHQSTSDATAANRLINWITTGTTPLAAGKGTAQYQYDATTARWRLIAHEQGTDITRTFAAGNFTAFGGGNSWTVGAADIVRDTYYVHGKYLTLNMYYAATSVGGAPTYLLVTLPNSFASSTDLNATGLSVINNGGAIEVGVFLTNALGSTVLGCERISAVAWSVSTDNTFVRGSANFQLD